MERQQRWTLYCCLNPSQVWSALVWWSLAKWRCSPGAATCSSGWLHARSEDKVLYFVYLDKPALRCCRSTCVCACSRVLQLQCVSYNYYVCPTTTMCVLQLQCVSYNYNVCPINTMCVLQIQCVSYNYNVCPTTTMCAYSRVVHLPWTLLE
jgi:hypothetical protein